MELSLNSHCEKLRHANTKIEQENRTLRTLIASQEKEDRVQGELRRLSEIRKHDEGRAEDTDYGENSQTLQKWDSSWSERSVPASCPLEEQHKNDVQPDPQLTESWSREEDSCGIIYNQQQQDSSWCSDNKQSQSSVQMADKQPLQQDYRQEPSKHIVRGTHEPGLQISPPRYPVKEMFPKLGPQEVQKIIHERDHYKEKARKLEGHVENLCHERAQMEQKYQIKLEVCQRLEEDNRRLSSKTPRDSSRATLATDDDVEVLKEACRVYQEDFQTERSEREAAHTEKKRLRAELEHSKQEIRDLNEKVMLLLSILGRHQPPSPLRKPSYPWEFNEVYRPSSAGSFVRQRRYTDFTPSQRQFGDVIRRGIRGNKRTDLCPDPYAVVDDLDVKDGTSDGHYYRHRRKSMSL